MSKLPPEVAKAMTTMTPPQDAAAQFEAKVAAQLSKEKATYDALKADFPKEAYSTDKSRGFALTSIKAQYVVERLNEVLGVAGWSMTGTYEQIKDTQGNITGILYLGELQAVFGGRIQKVQAPGYSKLDAKKQLGDAYKGAKTDALSKAASWLGVGSSVFKGNVDPETFEHNAVTTTHNIVATKQSGQAAAARSSFAPKTTNGSTKSDPFA